MKTGSNTGSTYSKCGRPKNIWSINMLQGMQAILILHQTFLSSTPSRIEY